MTVASDHNPYVGDVGVVFEQTLFKASDHNVLDVSTATKLYFLFFKPDNTTVQKTAVLSTDGKDGKVRYSTEAGFLDMAGAWKYQVYAEGPFGHFHTDPIMTFKVQAPVALVV